LSAQQIGTVIRETATRFSGIEPPLIINEEEVQPKSGVTNLLAPGLIVFGLMILISISAGMMVGDKEKGFLSRLLTTPIRSSEFMAAYALPFIAIAIIQLIIFIGVGVLIGLKIHGGIPHTFLIFFLTAVCSIGIGMILGSLAKSKTQSDAIAWVIIVFSAFLSGAWVPLDIVPSYWRSVAYALPFAHATDATRAILSKGMEFGVIATDFYWLIGWMVVLFAAGIMLFRGRMVSRG
jgi:ABC-2 type transport system permease protein